MAKGSGVKQWRVSTIFPVGRAAEEPEFRLTGEELKQVIDFIRTTRKEGIIRASYGCEGFLVSVPTTIRETSIRMIFGKYGKQNSNLTVTVRG